MKYIKYYWNWFYWGKELADFFWRSEYMLDRLLEHEKEMRAKYPDYDDWDDWPEE